MTDDDADPLPVRRRSKSKRKSLRPLVIAAIGICLVAGAVVAVTTSREKKPGDSMLVEGRIEQTTINIDDVINAMDETKYQARGIVVLEMSGKRQAICHFRPGTEMRVSRVHQTVGPRTTVMIRGRFESYAGGGHIVILQDCEFAGSLAGRW